MDRDYGKELDELRQQIDEIRNTFQNDIKKLFAGRESSEEKDYKKVQPMKNMHPDTRLSSLMEGLCSYVDGSEVSGAITYLGVFASGGRQSNWIKNTIETNSLLKLIENNSVTAVLNCIGNSDRLNILLALLRAPMTVASLVDKCGFGSTGQAYHHLRPLLAADIVYEDENEERGVYAVRPHRVQGIIMLLAGIADLLDTGYTQGTWLGEDGDTARDI